MRVEVTKVRRMTMNSNLEELLVNKGHLTGESRWLRRNRYYTLSVLHSFFHQHCSICLEFIWLLGWIEVEVMKYRIGGKCLNFSFIDLFYWAEEFSSRFLVQFITFIQMTNVAHKSESFLLSI